MSQPPQPLARTPKTAPVPLARATPMANNSPTSPGGAPKIDMETLGAGMIRPGLNAPREKILLAGDTNSGKSFAYVQEAERCFIKEADLEPEKRTKFYMIDTDDTAPKYFAEGRSYAHLYFENGGNVYPFYVDSWPTFARAANYITREAKRGDWIIVDLASSAYAMAQEFIANLKGLNLDDEVVKRMSAWSPGARKQGFGAFDGDTWGLVSRTYEASMRPLVNNSRGAHFVGLAHVTDMQTEAKRETREPILLFDQLGMKPSGVGKLTKLVDTAIVLWSARPMNEDGKSSSPVIVRNMTLVKDRDEACHYTRPFTDCFVDLKVFRRTITKTANIVDPVAAEQINEAARNAFQAPPAESEPDESTTDPTAEADRPEEVEGAGEE